MDSKVENKGLKELKLYNHRGIEIQCPDCGDIFIPTEDGDCFCVRCNRVFQEDEVRARCGI
jgi:uncharacterized OB-fold protein